MNSAVNWLLALIFAALLSGAWLLDAPTDHHATRAQAAAVTDATRAAQAQARFARATKKICGENAAWSEVRTGIVQCTTKRGFKTMIARVQP